RNFFVDELRAQALVEPDDRAVVDEVHEALEAALDTDREIQNGRTRAQAILDHVNAALKAGAGTVELVDKAHPGNVILLGLAPDSLRLRLDAGNAVETGDRAVEDAQRALDLNCKIDVARRIDDVDPVLGALALVSAPETGRRGRRDGDPALLLLHHPVHRRGAFVHFADLVGLAGVIEDALRRRRLAGIDVRHDADVAIAFERMAAGHFRFSLAMWGAGGSGFPRYRYGFYQR